MLQSNNHYFICEMQSNYESLKTINLIDFWLITNLCSGNFFKAKILNSEKGLLQDKSTVKISTASTACHFWASKSYAKRFNFDNSFPFLNHIYIKFNSGFLFSTRPTRPILLCKKTQGFIEFLLLLYLLY